MNAIKTSENYECSLKLHYNAKAFKKCSHLTLKKIDMDNLVLDLSSITCEVTEVV